MPVASLNFSLRVALGLAAVAISTTALAQDLPVHPMGTPEMMGIYAMGSAMDYAASEGANDVVRSKTRAPVDPAAAADQLTYVATTARTQANIAAFVARSRKSDPTGAAAIAELFASQDVMSAAEVELRKVGLTKSNMADAYTAWWTNAWLASQGRDDTLPRKQMLAVKRQAEAALLATPQVAQLNDTQKQAFAEDLLIQAMLIGASIEVAKAQGVDVTPLKEAVVKGARAAGLDLRSMMLSDQGFIPIGMTKP